MMGNSKEIRRRVRLKRAVKKELEIIFEYMDITLETKAKIIHTLVFLLARYECESWTLDKAAS